MRWAWGIALGLFLSNIGYGQATTSQRLRFVTSNPAGGCSPVYVTVNTSTGDEYACVGSTWTKINVGSGTGITSLNGLNGASQTFGNDTNVTIVSAGSTHTITWAGNLAVGRGGTGATTFVANEILLGNGTSAVGQVASLGTTTTLLHGNASGAPTFGSVVNADIAAATIDLTAKVTGLLPAGNGGTNNGFFQVTGPATSTKTYTLNNATTTIVTTADTVIVTNAMLAGSIAASKLVGTDIATVGTITSGTWQGTAIDSTRGGLGASFAACTGSPTFSAGTASCTALTGTLGSIVASISPTFTGTVSAAALTLTGTLTSNLTGGGTQCVQTSNTGVLSGTGAVCGGNPPLSSIQAATAANTIASGNNPQTWNWAQTTNNQTAMAFGETSAATGGTLTNALANQAEVGISTASASTATPLNITQGSVTAASGPAAFQIQTTWNNASLVGEGILFNATSTSSAAGSKVLDLRVGNTAQFTVDKSGNGVFAGTVTSTLGGSNAGAVNLTQGTDNSGSLPVNSVGFQAPTTVTTAFIFTLPGAQAAGFFRATNANPSVMSIGEISGGDCATSGSFVLTCTKVNGVSYPTTGASFDALPILTASNTVGYFQINGGAACGDASHALSYNQTTHLFGCQSITGSSAAGGSNTQIQYNNSGALGGISGFTTNGTTTISVAGSSILDLSAATGTAAFKLPTTTTNTASAAGVFDYDSTNSNYHANSGADSLVGIVPTASIPANGHVIDASVVSSKLLLHDSGLVTANVAQINVAQSWTAVQTLGAGGAVETNNSFSTGTITTGHLACFTASNTVGNCTGVPSNNFVGVFDGTGGNIKAANQVASVSLDATVSVTFGDIVCASSTSAGNAHDNGSTPCTNGEWVGVVQTTAASVSTATVMLRLQ